MKPVEVRRELADALKLDLVGPSERLGSPTEVLPQAPSRWYLTGFLVPLDADQSQKVDEDSNDSVDAAAMPAEPTTRGHQNQPRHGKAICLHQQGSAFWLSSKTKKLKT